MEFDLNDQGEIGKTPPIIEPSNIFCYSLHLLLSVMTHNILTYSYYISTLNVLAVFDLYRFNGVKTNAGKTWIGQDSPRAEKDDVRGGWRYI